MAAQTLAEAAAEMEAIAFVKKQLMKQWKSSLIGMQRRDEALQSTEEVPRKQREKQMSIENEIEGYKQSIKREHENNERLTSMLAKVEKETAFLEAQFKTLHAQRDKLYEKYNTLKNSLDRTDQENKNIEMQCKEVQSDISSVEKQIQKLAQKLRDSEDAQLEVTDEQTILKNGSQGIVQSIEKIRNLIRDKEMQVSQLENELARVKVDELGTSSHNAELDLALKEVERELEQRGAMMEKFNLEIRRKHDEIERKQGYLDKLNRRFDDIMAMMANADEGEDIGPLEATIQNLTRSITQKEQENEQLKRDWIKFQTELVALVNKIAEVTDQIQDLKSRQTILTQKKMRLESSTATERTEVSELESGMRQMHLEMNKLNELISKNAKLQAVLADQNFDLQNDIMARLQSLENDARRMEDNIRQVRDAKRRLLNETIDAEHQIMLWEKKIQIQKETIDALDPNIGQEEIGRMRREIHLMEQRLVELKRKAKQKIEEMEKAIEKRDVITTKGRAIMQNNKNGITKVQLQREVEALNRDLSSKKKEAAAKDQKIRQLLNETEEAARIVEEIQNESARLRAEFANLQNEYNAMSAEKRRVADEKLRYNKMCDRYEKWSRGEYIFSIAMTGASSAKPGTIGNKEKLEMELHKQMEQNRKIEALIHQMKKQFQELEVEL